MLMVAVVLDNPPSGFPPLIPPRFSAAKFRPHQAPPTSSGRISNQVRRRTSALLSTGGATIFNFQQFHSPAGLARPGSALHAWPRVQFSSPARPLTRPPPVLNRNQRAPTSARSSASTG